MQEKNTRLIAIYLPQFHPIPENDKAWGKGFTEWRNVAQAVPQFTNHYQPHMPADLGFYDLRLDEIRQEQIELAKKYGISGFCYYYYWFNGKQVLETPINKLLVNTKLNFPFCVCWANENWTRKWDGHDEEIILKQDHNFDDDRNFIQSLFPYFRDKRYIKINNKLLLSIYRTDLFPDIKQTAQIWREEVRKAGLGELYLTRMESFVKGVDPKEIGFDAAIEFAPDWSQMGNRIDYSKSNPNTKDLRIFDYKTLANNMAAREASPYKLFRSVTPSWDNTARQGNKSLVFIKSSPGVYENWLTKIIKYTKQNLSGEEKVIFINAWNEWAEGNHLEPDLVFGHKYLEATQNALIKEGEFKSASSKLVSIVIPAFNQLDYTKQCIESIRKLTDDYEIIVINNASSDGTKEYLTECKNKFPNFTVIDNEINIGFPKAVNQGILEAKGDFILIANNDILFTEKWLDKMVTVAGSDSQVGLVGPISNEVSGLQKDETATYKSIEQMYTHAAKINEKNKGEVLNFPRIAFLCTLVKKEVIEKIGGLDERFSPGNFEDDDFCLRAQLAGYKTVIAKDVFIHHYGSKSFKANGEDKYAKRLQLNKQKFIEKWGVTPEELWLENKTITPKQIKYPISSEKFIQYFERARIHMADKEYSLALESLNSAIENYNLIDAEKFGVSLEEILNLAGNVGIVVNDLETAKKHFEQELSVNPNSSSACVGLGEIFFINEQYDGAKALFEWAVRNDESNNSAVESLKKVNSVLGFEPIHNSLFQED